MRTLTIGSTTLELQQPFIKRWDKGRGVFAEIKIPSTEISYEELKALFKDNQHDLIVTEEDGSTEAFSGYTELDGIKESISEGLYIVTQYCTETAMHLLNEARKQIEEQQGTISTMQGTIELQTAEILTQAEVIVAQGETIAAQNEQVEKLLEASASQLDAIDFILTEGLPLVAQEAATMALAAISEEETPDEEAEYYMEKEQEAYEEMIASETITEEN